MDNLFLQLKRNDRITPTRHLSNARQWKYASECGTYGGGMMPGAELIITDTNFAAGNYFIKAKMTAFDPPQFLKISAEEFINNFKKI